MVATTACWLFGRALDYCWCHPAIRAGRLRQVLPNVTHNDIAHVAEIILAIRQDVQLRSVDWLAGEDHFILGGDLDELRREREADHAETQRRLAYALPMLQLLRQVAGS